MTNKKAPIKSKKASKKRIAIAKVELAISKIEEARDLIDEVIEENFKAFSIGTHYHVYGEYGIKQLLGEGNPGDGCLQDLIDKLTEEE